MHAALSVLTHAFSWHNIKQRGSFTLLIYNAVLIYRPLSLKDQCDYEIAETLYIVLLRMWYWKQFYIQQSAWCLQHGLCSHQAALPVMLSQPNLWMLCMFWPSALAVRWLGAIWLFLHYRDSSLHLIKHLAYHTANMLKMLMLLLAREVRAGRTVL